MESSADWEGLQNLVVYSFMHLGHEKTISLLDTLQDMGFVNATRSGLSFASNDIAIASNDIAIPQATETLLEQAHHDVDLVEKHNKIIDIWHRVTEDVAREMS